MRQNQCLANCKAKSRERGVACCGSGLQVCLERQTSTAGLAARLHLRPPRLPTRQLHSPQEGRAQPQGRGRHGSGAGRLTLTWMRSTGTPLVSGTKKATNRVIRPTQPAKKMNTPHLHGGMQRARGGRAGKQAAAGAGSYAAQLQAVPRCPRSLHGAQHVEEALANHKLREREESRGRQEAMSTAQQATGGSNPSQCVHRSVQLGLHPSEAQPVGWPRWPPPPPHTHTHIPPHTEKRKLTVTATLMPAARVSSVWISEGTSQPRGPQDQAKPAENGGAPAGQGQCWGRPLGRRGGQGHCTGIGRRDPRPCCQ